MNEWNSVRSFAFCLLLCLAAFLSDQIGRTEAAPPSQATADPVKSGSQQLTVGFDVRDQYGNQRNTQTVTSRVYVLAFIGVECPLARLYTQRLNELAAQWKERDVVIWGIDSNVQDSLTEIADFARQHSLQFPVFKDPDNRLADYLAAERTPEVFVFDEQRQLKYRGRIDDQYGIGVQRTQPAHTELIDAVRALLSDEQPSVAHTEPVGCLIGRRRVVKPRGEITYSRHIAAIFNRRCVECHRAGEIAPFPMTSYDELTGWESMIAEVIEEERMPPWTANPEFGHFRNDARLNEQEKSQILTWIANGCPEGDPSELPPAPEFADGWRIPEPDLVVKMRDKPFAVPAEGTVKYQYFPVDFDTSEDRFVSAVEARPGNRAVVHHIIAYIRPHSDEPENRRGPGRMLVGYAPGTVPVNLPEGWAIQIPKGWEMIFELHYTPNGTPQEDLSDIGLKFIPKDQVRRIVSGEAIMNRDFVIPAEKDNHQVVAERTLKRDLHVTSMTPHMHVRGKSFRYEAFYPDGTHEILLDVPDYDFNWQLTYQLQETKLLPKGTRIVCTAHFDNSSDNPNNPDPNKSIEWGQQSWEEMMIGFFSVVSPEENP